jgi:hypothetical protein
MLHVLFDAVLYSEIKPFYPLTVNPLYRWNASLEIYLLSFWMGILGLIFYLLLTVWHIRKRRKAKGETL